MASLELQLNATARENADLRRTVDILHDRSAANATADSGPHLHRNPRNFDEEEPASASGEPCSSTIAFDAFRNKPFYTAQTYLTFDGTMVNAGGGFDPNTGLFTAPRAGIYSFSFHALTQDGSPTYVKIIHNGRNVGGAYRRHEGEGDAADEDVALDSGDVSPSTLIFVHCS